MTARVPTADDLATMRLETRAATAQFPDPVGPALEAALSTLIAQVESEVQGTTAVTLAGELLDGLDQGASPAAIDAGIWQALTTLHLAPPSTMNRTSTLSLSPCRTPITSSDYFHHFSLLPHTEVVCASFAASRQ